MTDSPKILGGDVRNRLAIERNDKKMSIKGALLRIGLPALLLGVGMYMFTYVAVHFAGKHGEWDAWDMWNLKAQFLSDPDNWHNLFRYKERTHVDYPLCLPATIAFFLRLFGSDYLLIVPFVFAFLTSICMPVMIFNEISGRNIILAALVFAVYIFDGIYVVVGVHQYAEVVIALFFLSACVCINYAATDRKYLVLSALFLGLCAWAKNEGLILAAIFLLFYAKTFFSGQNYKLTLFSLAFPLGVLAIFKLSFDVQNDMVSGIGSDTWSYLFDGSRYQQIFDSFVIRIGHRFKYTALLFACYLLACIIQKKMPAKQVLLVLCCLIAYQGIYVVTPMDLDWHLRTSQDRLMYQVFPSLLYAMFNSLADIKFPYMDKWDAWTA